MKRKEVKELPAKKKEELEKAIQKTIEEIVKLKMDKQVGKLKNISLLREKKRDLARLKTVLKNKELKS